MDDLNKFDIQSPSSISRAAAREAAWLAKQAANKPASAFAEDDARKQAAKEKAEAREAAWLARQQAKANQVS